MYVTILRWRRGTVMAVVSAFDPLCVKKAEAVNAVLCRRRRRDP